MIDLFGFACSLNGWVRGLLGMPKLPEGYCEQTFEKLEKAVIDIQNSNSHECSQEELYQAVENLCSNKMAQILYSELYALIERHVCKSVKVFLGEFWDSFCYLKMMNDAWQAHCNQMLKIRSVFLYLDRTYVLKNHHIASIWDMGLELFGKYLLLNHLIQKRVVKGLLNLIEKERHGDTVDHTLLKSLLKMLVDLTLYWEAFENKFLLATEQVYSIEAHKLMQELQVPEYLAHIDRRLQEESERVVRYLDMSTKEPLIFVVERHLIGKCLNKILQKGFDELLDGNRLSDLNLLYLLCARVMNGLDEVCVAFNEYIKKRGKNIVIEPEKDNMMVEELLAFKDAMDNVVATCFNLNEKFSNTIKEAFEFFINQRANKPAEMIAKFLNSLLKAGNKENADDDMEKILDKVMVLFRFIHGKDVFEAFYKKDLAKRLLLGKSASVDAEKSMLSKLKRECGGAFTSKLEGMFKDVELSKDISITFRQYLSNTRVELTKFDMTVNVLTMGHWPTYPVTNVTIPEDMLQLQDIFKDFYLSKHSGRKLQWQPILGHCVLRAKFKGGLKELVVSLFQALVVLLFNTQDEISFEYIKAATNIEDFELRKTLQSLACGKTRILNKIPKGRDIDDGDKFKFNEDFTHKLFRFKINQIQMKETVIKMLFIFVS